MELGRRPPGDSAGQQGPLPLAAPAPVQTPIKGSDSSWLKSSSPALMGRKRKQPCLSLRALGARGRGHGLLAPSPFLQVKGAESRAGPQPGWGGSLLGCGPRREPSPQGAPAGFSPGTSCPAQSASVVRAVVTCGAAAAAPRRTPRPQLRSPVFSALVTSGLSLTLSCPCDISGF